MTTRNDGLYKELTTGDSFLRSFFKVIKSGVELQSVGKVFITGILPITIDDLISGFCLKLKKRCIIQQLSPIFSNDLL
ncbi:AAA family ATPase [uncultured Desulfobacter sp.]|uniref:AAA family ATPase n=1 Tax=uncultured Desulfobacter sp. TaxID=240139 RepID=UPI003747BD44